VTTPPGHSEGAASSRLSTFVHAVGSAWALLVGIALLMIGTGLQGSLLGLRASLEGFGTATTGVVMSSYYLGYLLGSTRAVQLVATVGHIRVFAAFASIASSSVLLHALFLEPVGWVVLRVASGFCMAGLFVVAESWLNDTATNETRGSLLSLYMVVVSGGMGVGQLLLNVSPADGFVLFIVTSVLMSLALVPAALSVRAAPRMLQPARVSLRAVFTAAPLGVVGVLFAGAASGALFGMGVIYAQLVGLTLGQTSAFMLVAILGGAVLQGPIGRSPTTPTGDASSR
jgi:MFS family permease